MAHVGQKLAFGAVRRLCLVFGQLQFGSLLKHPGLQVFLRPQDGLGHRIERTRRLRDFVIPHHL